LFFAVANLPMTLLMNWGYKTQSKLETGFIKFVFEMFFTILRLVQSVSNLMVMYQSRQNEYRADYFALLCNYGTDLSEALTEIYEISLESPMMIKEQLNSTHPSITKRIEILENALNSY